MSLDTEYLIITHTHQIPRIGIILHLIPCPALDFVSPDQVSHGKVVRPPYPTTPTHAVAVTNWSLYLPMLTAVGGDFALALGVHRRPSCSRVS